MTETGQPRRHVFSVRARRNLWIGGTILAGAIVILVVGALSLPKSGVVPTLPPISVPGQGDYSAGMAALAAGDTTKAVALLNSAAAAGNESARQRLTEIAAGTSPKPATPGSPGTSTIPGDDSYARPISDIATLLPASMAGYAAATVERSSAGAILAFEPAYGGPYYGKVTLVVLSVLDKGSDAQARAYVEQLTRAYRANGEVVTVGARQGRFGTDGSHLASVTFSRGRYAFEAVATSARPDPSKIRDITISAAASFGAAK